MSMIASSSHSDPSLQVLLEAFGSRFSLDDIAAAYCQASQNVDVAGEILFAMTETTPQSDKVKMKGATSKPTHVYVPKDVRRQEDSKEKIWMPKRGSTSVGTMSSDIGNVDVAGDRNVASKSPQSDKVIIKGPTLKPTHVDVHRQEDSKTKAWKQKKGPTSIGTVTSVIGKEYFRTRPLANAPREATKPMKIDSKEIPETEIWGEEMPESNKANISRVPADVEEFIVKMLGEGFQFSQDVIHEVLVACGYDVKKSTEKLLDLSDTIKYADVGTSYGITQGQGSTACNPVEPQEVSQSDGGRSLTGLEEGGKDKTGLEKEVLEALFSGVERYEEVPKITRRIGERRARVAGRPVIKPLEDPFQERVVAVKQSSQTSKEDEEDDIEFKAQHKAAHEYWHQTKEYYRAAVEAFTKGETERAHRLVEKGHFFKQKAQEADEKSIAKTVEPKKNDDSTYKEDEVVTVNVNEHEPKEALRLLKRQLLYFSGIDSFKYLRVKLGDNKEDSKCKRRLNAIAKLLEGESIVWSEEDNGLVMMIRVDEIDPKKLSFAKK